MGYKTNDNRSREGLSPESANAGPIVEIRSLSHFESEVIDSELPAVVDFWGRGCGACKGMAPTLLASADAFEGKAKFVKVNTEINTQVAKAFNIRSLPTLAVFYQGEVVDVHVGATPRNQLDAMVRRAVDRHEGIGFVDKIKRFWSGGAKPA